MALFTSASFLAFSAATRSFSASSAAFSLAARDCYKIIMNIQKKEEE